MQILRSTFISIVMGIFILQTPLLAQIDEFKLTADDAAENDRFGLSVSINGEYAVIGSPQDDDDGSNSGSVYVFKHSSGSWNQEAKLLPNDGMEWNGFGGSVSISGDYLVVGVDQDDENGNNSGAIYIFKNSGTAWTQEAKIHASDAAALDHFGYSVSISGDYLVAGAHEDSDNGTQSGSIYIFHRSGTSWIQEAKLLASDGSPYDHFGRTVAIAGDYVAVGVAEDDDFGNSSGSVYIFKRADTIWDQEAKIVANDAATNNSFGKSVAIHQDYAAIGSNNAGYVFKRTGISWVQEAKLETADGSLGDGFGSPISIDDHNIAIGAYRDDDNGNHSGATYMFTHDETAWTQEFKFLASDGEEDDFFGVSVCISGGYVIVGAFGNADNGSNTGAAYIFGGLLPPVGVLSYSQSPLNFGLVSAGSPTTQPLTITNTGTADLNVSALELTGADALSFSVDSTPFTLVPGDSLQLDVNFSPNATGTYSAVIDIQSDGGNASIVLSGSGIVIENPETKLLAIDGSTDDLFGYAVSVSGNYAVVGSPHDDDNGSNSGAAYIFKHNGTIWGQEAKLLPTDAAALDNFGEFASISGDYVIIGARLNDDNGSSSGSAYIFKRSGTTWIQEAKLLPADGAADDLFGVSVSISGDYCIVGSPYDDDNGTNSGSVYIFNRTGTSWEQESKLLPTDGAGWDIFGWAVAIDGDRCIVGAWYDDDNGSFSGSAYIFNRSGTNWTQEAKLLPSDGAADDNFGISVSIADDYTIVGAHGDADNGTASGSAYIFSRNGAFWTQEAKLLPSDGGADDVFGRSVSISGEYAIVGAYQDTDNGTGSGSAYIFKRTVSTWNQESKLLASNGATDDQLGYSVAISGNFAILGASGDDDNGSNSGSALIHTVINTPSLTLSPVLLDYDLVSVGTSTTQQLTITNTGTADLNVSDLNITGTNASSFSVDTTPFTLPPGASQILDITFTPAVTGNYSATIDIQSDGGDASVALLGAGIVIEQLDNKILAADGASGDNFGFSVSISGDYAIVGATGESDNGLNSGAVYVFKRNGSIWIQESKLQSTDGASNDRFGGSVFVSGDYAIVGAHGDEDNGFRSGSAYMFKRTGDTWTQESKLLPSDGAENKYFGSSVSIYDDYAAIGSIGDDDNGSYSGSVYIFQRSGSNWIQESKLLASDGATNDHFGTSVSISTEYIIVGASGGGDNGFRSGSAYLFKRSGTNWTQDTKLLPSDGVVGGYFGVSVSISDDYAIVGATRSLNSGIQSGSAYLFKRVGTIWEQDSKLRANDGAVDDEFGISVSISGNYAFVGAHSDKDNGDRSGSAYVFKRNGDIWFQESKLLPTDGTTNGRFGGSVFVSSDFAIIGAYGDDSNGGNSGSAYIHTLFTTPSLAVIQESLDYGLLSVGEITTQELTVTNTGTADLNVSDITITGTNASSFSVDTTPFTLPPGASQILDITFTPDVTGNYSATIDIQSDGGDTSVALLGAGIVIEQLGNEVWASDVATNDDFGWSVSISGNYAIIGAYGDDDNGSASGSAYIFKRTETSWTQEAKLLPTDGAYSDYFGYSVSISGDYVVVGAHLDDDNEDNSGAAFIFKRTGSTWTQEAKLLASDGATNDKFGWSVSISGNYAIIGADGDDDNGSASGSAYIFKRTVTNWIQESKLLATDGAESDQFGSSVSISGDYAIIGAKNDDDNGTNSGSAYVFHRSGTTWTQQSKLLASDGAVIDQFGYSVSISSDYVIIGAKNDDDNGINSGSAYVFHRSGTTWIQESKLLASDGTTSDQFGSSVSISGDYAIIGAWYDVNNEIRSGSAYLFKRSSTVWSQESKMLASEGAESDQFGLSVSISGNFAIVGTPKDNDNNLNSGSAYIHTGFAPTGVLAVTPDFLDFATLEVGEFSNELLNIRNIGTADLSVSSISIGGPDSLNFSADASAFSLIPGDSLLLEVSFAPIDTGSVFATLTINSDGGNASVNLSGTAIQSGLPNFKLTASDGTEGDSFGNSVSVSGDYAIVGAILDDTHAGSAYIYHRDGESWIEQSKLTASDGADYANFGSSVSISGNYAIVGAQHDHGTGYQMGSAYIFIRDGLAWVQQAKLIASDAANYDKFGASVSISGNTAIVGAYWDDDGGDDAGSAYIFVFDGLNWIEQTKLTANEAASQDFFGFSVAISGNTAIVGAEHDNSVGSSAGAAYIYVREGSSWILETKLEASDGASGDWFGGSVALDGNAAIIGARGIGAYLGGAYIFKRDGSTWTEEVKLTSSNAHNYNNFGSSVAINGNYAVVGAPHNPFQESDTSSAYIFVKEGSNWIEQDIVTSNHPIENYAFGKSVAIDGELAIVGSQGDGSVAPYTGSAYVITGFNPYGILTVSAPSLAFGDVIAGESTADNLILRNTGAMDLNIASMAITGNDLTSFSISTSSSIIIPGDSLILDLSFSPDHGGVHLATLTIVSDVGSRSVGLSGQGILLVPDPFELIAPLVDEQIQMINPIFRWNASAYPIATDTLFYTLFLDTPEPGVEIYPVGQDTVYTVEFDLTDNTNYFWKVTATVPQGTSLENTGGFQSFTVNTANDPPGAFNLLSPAYDEMVTNLQPEFLWEMSSDPDDLSMTSAGFDVGIKHFSVTSRQDLPGQSSEVVRDVISPKTTERGLFIEQPGPGENSTQVITGYEFYLGTDPMFTEVTPVEVFGNSFTPTALLTENQVYFWTVSALDDAGGVTFTDTSSFWTNAANESPTEFSLLLPALDEIVTVLSPTFMWSASSDPDLEDWYDYYLVIASDPANQDTVVVGSDTTLSLTWDLMDNQTYSWLVYAEDGYGLKTPNTGGFQSFTVNTANDLPLDFELLSPGDDEMVSNLLPEFLWEMSSDPDDVSLTLRETNRTKYSEGVDSGNNSVDAITAYEFYLGTDPMLIDIIPVEVFGTSYTPPADLIENQLYYWTVSALDDSGGVTFSDTAAFWTNSENEAPTEFSLLEPAQSDQITSLIPTFTWESSSDPDLQDSIDYFLLYGSNLLHMDTAWTGSDTSFTPQSELADNSIYFWSVLAKDNEGLITFNMNGYASFVINQANDNPAVVDLITPDSVMVLSLTPEMVWTVAMDVDPGDFVSYEMHWWGTGMDHDSVLTDTNAVILPRELVDNTQYFWQVISLDQIGGISHSPDASFWADLVPEAPSMFALTSPGDGVIGLPPTPSFTWEASADPDPLDYAVYTLQIATDSNFTDIAQEGLADINPTYDLTEALPIDTDYWWRVIAMDTDSLRTESEVFKFTVGTVSITSTALPEEYVLQQNYPNPFNPSTTIKYGLPEDSNVSVVIYDIRGNVVKMIDSGRQAAGWYEHMWNGLNDVGQPISTGLYFTRLNAGTYSKTMKMLYLK